MDFRSGKVNSDLPLVTIGVLSYNYAQYIIDALNSLLQQTYLNIELIIVDDASSDNSRVLIEEWIRQNNIHCTYIMNEENLGITKVSNIIVNKAKGKYLSLFATDDLMLPEKIARQVEILEQAGEEYGMCYSNVDTMDEEGKSLGPFIKSSFNKLEGDVLEAYVFNQLSFATPSALIRKSVYERVGLYEERILIEDYNFWLRVFACYKVNCCDYPCLAYRVKKESQIWDKWAANKNERYYHDRIISNFDALKFITNDKVKKQLQSKISQYLKTLSANQSNYTKPLITVLLKNGYYKIPAKVLLAEGLNSLTTKKSALAN
jgi:glycosyltransferase involved in cell wall biosynthesis